MFKKVISILIEQPLLTSLFVTDLGMLMFAALLGMTMYYGQKLSLFKV